MPAPIDSQGVQSIAGTAVVIASFDGGTSGRFDVAIYGSRLFPRVAAEFVERVKSESLVSARDFERGPYVNDSVRYLDSLTAEYTTPPHATGLGTEGPFSPSADAIRGVAVLCAHGDWSFSILQMRLGPTMRHLEAATLRLNRDAVRRGSC